MSDLEKGYIVYAGGLAHPITNEDTAISVARILLKKTPTVNGRVPPVAIFNADTGVLVFVVSDDSNRITVHRLGK